MLPTSAEWKRGTASALHKRSKALAALDRALEQYEKTKAPLDYSRLKDALHLWKEAQKERGQLWERSVRNKTGMVTRLNRELDNVFERTFSPEEIEALRYIARIQSQALAKQFENVTVSFKSHTLMGMKNTVREHWDKIKAGGTTSGHDGEGNRRRVNWGKVTQTGKSLFTARKVGSGIGKNVQSLHDLSQVGRSGVSAASSAGLQAKLVQLCNTLCPNKDPNEVFRALGLPPVAQFSADLAPLVGALTSGAAAVNAWRQAITLQWKRDGVGKSRYAFAPDDPAAALDAVMELLDRETNAAAMRAGVKTAAFGGKVAGAFLDAGGATGPVIGIAESLTVILQTIYEYVRDVHEVDNANRLIQLGALNLDLFDVCPILGCYFLVLQDHSTIVNCAVGQYGYNGWQGDVEQLMMKVEPVLGHAQRYIHQSRFEIAAFQKMKGVVKRSGYMAGPLGSYVREGQVKPVGLEIRDRVDQGTDRVGGALVNMRNRIAEWRRSPLRPPEPDAERHVL